MRAAADHLLPVPIMVHIHHLSPLSVTEGAKRLTGSGYSVLVLRARRDLAIRLGGYCSGSSHHLYAHIRQFFEQ
jgi:hypothetical protein